MGRVPPHNSKVLTCSKKPFKHELGGGEYWGNEALHTKIDGFGTRYNGDEQLSIVITRPKFSAFLKIRRRLALYKPLLALRNSFGILGHLVPKESGRITQSKKGFVPELDGGEV